MLVPLLKGVSLRVETLSSSLLRTAFTKQLYKNPQRESPALYYQKLQEELATRNKKTGHHGSRNGVRNLLPNLQRRSAVSSTAELQTHVLWELSVDARAIREDSRTPNAVSAVPSLHVAVRCESPRQPTRRQRHFWAASNCGQLGGMYGWRWRHRGTPAGRVQPTERGCFTAAKITKRTPDEMHTAPVQKSQRGCAEKWVFYLDNVLL